MKMSMSLSIVFVLILGSAVLLHVSYALPVRHQLLPRRQTIRYPTTLRVIDPATLDNAIIYGNTIGLDTSSKLLLETADAAQNTFFNTVTARTIGAVLGNVLAAIVIKIGSDFFSKKVEEISSKMSPESVAPPPPSITDKLSSIPLSGYAKLILCLAIDLGSDASFLIPGIGEAEDIAWAPISAYALNLIFGSNAVSGLEFAKEILPGTDILPLATLAWLLQNVFIESPLTGALGLRKPSSAPTTSPQNKNNN